MIHDKKTLVALEVKTGTAFRHSGIDLFSSQFSPQKSLLIGKGGLSVEEFLKTPLPKLLS